MIVLIWSVLWTSGTMWNPFMWPWGRRYYYGDVYTSETCIMAPLNTEPNICAYLSIVSGLSIALSIFMLLLACFHFSKQRRRPAGAPLQKLSPLELFLSLFGVLWWIAGAITATIYGNRADNDGLREEDERPAVWSLSWVNVGLFGLLLGLEIIKFCFEPRKSRYPGPGIASGGVQSEAPPSTHHVAAPPASPIPASPFIVPGYPTSTIQMYGGYPLATEPPPPLNQSR